MADFLVSLVKSGRNVIVETHSENLLLRIRRSIASRGNTRLDPGTVSVIVVEKRSDGTSVARGLEVDDLGQIQGWPRGFMEEATEERMDLLEAQSGRAPR